MIRLSTAQEAELDVRYAAFEELLLKKTSDIVSLHIPLTAENKDLIDRRTIALRNERG